MTRFDVFVGVDWSGATTCGTKGVAVAECRPGSGPPRLVKSSERGRWRRSEVADWLSERIAGHGPVLIGIDFAFALPFCDCGAYLPGALDSPETLAGLWRLVDRVCAEDADLYAGRFVADPRFVRFFWSPGKRGASFRPRLRKTEDRCRGAGFGVPESVFKLIGPKQVGKGSLSGFRLFHGLKARHRAALRIWPFEALSRDRSVCVEIFPRLFIERARLPVVKLRNLELINRALARLGSEPLPEKHHCLDEHQADALVSAAGLRRLSCDRALWRPAEMTADIARYEGWIFGVA